MRPFVNKWATLTTEELERILDEAFEAVAAKKAEKCKQELTK
jgi:hypothetical protein